MQVFGPGRDRLSALVAGRVPYILWLLGVIELAFGAAFTGPAVLAAGWIGLLAATTLLCVNLLASLRAAPAPLSLPARLLAIAQTFLLAGLAAALIGTVQAGVDGPFVGSSREVLAVLLLAGWIGITVTGALLHLLAILARIRRRTTSMPRPQPARDRLTAATCIGCDAMSQLVNCDTGCSEHKLELVRAAAYDADCRIGRPDPR